jgi:hypothetical protein
MRKGLGWVLAVVLMVSGSVVSTGAVASSAALRVVEVVKKPKSVTMGARFAVTVKVGAAAQARRLRIQTQT